MHLVHVVGWYLERKLMINIGSCISLYHIFSNLLNNDHRNRSRGGRGDRGDDLHELEHRFSPGMERVSHGRPALL